MSLFGESPDHMITRADSAARGRGAWTRAGDSDDQHDPNHHCLMTRMTVTVTVTESPWHTPGPVIPTPDTGAAAWPRRTAPAAIIMMITMIS